MSDKWFDDGDDPRGGDERPPGDGEGPERPGQSDPSRPDPDRPDPSDPHAFGPWGPQGFDLGSFAGGGARAHGGPGMPGGPQGPGGGARVPRRPADPRKRGPLGPTVLILAVLGLLGSGAARLWTEKLWFDSVGFGGVFTTRLLSQIALFLVGFAITALLAWSSLVIAHRSRPVYVPTTPQQVALDQYREAIEPLRRVGTLAIPAILGLLGGTSAAAQWRTFLQWRNATPFGTTDPQFGHDISFFVFTLPWLRFIGSFLTMALLTAAVAAVVAHYVYGGLTIPGRGQETTPAARRHVAILIAALVLVRAGMYWLDRYQLAVQDSRLLTGLTYSDVHAVMPAKAILAVAAVMCALLFLASIATHSWRLPIVGTVLLTVTAVVAGGIYPALIQSLKVRPSEKSLESPYIQRSIDATRAAFGLDGVKVEPYTAATHATAGQLREDAATVPGIRIIDPNIVSPTFRQLQALRQYYAVPDTLDVDRYTIDGKSQDSVVAVRELDLAGINPAQRNWVNDHTVNTHGYGFIGAYGTKRTASGNPEFFERDYDPSGKIGKYEPRIYFGEESPVYSIVGAPAGAKPREFDRPDASAAGQSYYTYSGKGGVEIGSLARRLAYAIKYREVKFLLSDAVNERSRLLDHRDPIERVQRVAPWLTTDGNAYPTVVDGRVQWVIDGYTTSANYPYSRLTDLDGATSDSVTERSSSVSAINAGQVNYVRNSVKATVDAYDGSIRLYAWDTKDPMLKTWEKSFPGSVRPLSEVSSQLMQHVRYPQDLFKIQRALLAKYHVTEADSFYGGQDFWRVPKDPTHDTQDQPVYYLSMAMPGQKAATFSLTTAYVPAGTRNVLSGFLSVDSDAGSTKGKPAESYGTMRLLQLPRDSNVDGPGQVQNQIETSTERSASDSEQLNLGQFIANNRSAGKQLDYGNLLTLPVGQGMLYVEPLYVRAANENGSYPQVKAVVAVFGNTVAWGPTLDSALDRLFGGDSGAKAGDSGAAPGGGTTPTAPPKTGAAALQDALTQVQAAQAAAQAALKKGDWTAYGEAQKQLDAAIKKAVEAAPEGGAVTTTPAPSASPTSATS